MRTSRLLLTVCLVLPIAPAATAQAPLAERLPARPLVYLGWAGKTKALEDSAAGKLADDPAFQRVMTGIRDAVLKAVPEGQPRTIFEAAWGMATTVWKHPVAAAAIDVAPVAGRGEPVPSLALVADLGNDRKAFETHLEKLVSALDEDARPEQRQSANVAYRVVAGPERGMEVAFGFDGNVFFVCLGPVDLAGRLLGLKAADSLKSDKAFAAAVAEVGGEAPQYAFYADVKGILAAARKVIAHQERHREGPPESSGVARLDKVVKALGLSEATVLAAAGRFADGGVYSRGKLYSPAPHTGVLMPFAGKPLTEADLAGVPADADMMLAANCPMQAMLAELRRVLGATEPRALADFNEALGELDETLGTSVEKNILASLGDTFVLTSAASQGGFGTGTVVTIEVTDAKALAKAMASVEEGITRAAAGPTGPPEAPRRQPVRFQGIQAGGTDIRYAAIQTAPVPVAPAYAIANGKLYLAAWPQLVAAALDAAPRPAATPLRIAPALAPRPAGLLAEASFRKLRGRVAREPTVLMYVNTPRIMERLYPVMLLGFTAGMNAAARETGAAFDPGWLPPLSKLKQYAGPYIAAVSADKEGIVYEDFGSMPLQGLLGGPAAAAPVMASFLPALWTARDKARRVVSASNLHQIGTCLMVYAADNNGRLPPNLGVLVGEYGLIPGTLVSPSSGRQPPKVKDGEIVGDTDYEYIQLPSLQAIGEASEAVIAYEKPENYRGEGTLALFADGHVQWVTVPRLRQLLTATRRLSSP